MASPPIPSGSPRICVSQVSRIRAVTHWLTGQIFRGYTEEDLLTRKCIFSWDHPDIEIFTTFATAKNLYSRACKPKEIDITSLRKALELEANDRMAQAEIDVKILRKLRAVVLAGDPGEGGDAAGENDTVAASGMDTLGANKIADMEVFRVKTSSRMLTLDIRRSVETRSGWFLAAGALGSRCLSLASTFGAHSR